jgi:hypothetical protein
MHGAFEPDEVVEQGAKEFETILIAEKAGRVQSTAPDYVQRDASNMNRSGPRHRRQTARLAATLTFLWPKWDATLGRDSSQSY